MKRGDYMLQYKLIEVLDKNTLLKLNNIFGKKNIIKLTDRIVGIYYDFSENTYTDTLRKIVGLNLRQCILTSSRFLNIINYSLDNNLSLSSIDFLECIDENLTKNIKSSITKTKLVNDKNEKLKLKQSLIENLNWIMFDQSIDIQSILISIDVDFFPFTVEVRFFNNGVLYVDDINIIKHLNKLFEDCFTRR